MYWPKFNLGFTQNVRYKCLVRSPNTFWFGLLKPKFTEIRHLLSEMTVARRHDLHVGPSLFILRK